MKDQSSCVLVSWARPRSTPPPTTKCPRSRPHSLLPFRALKKADFGGAEPRAARAVIAFAACSHRASSGASSFGWHRLLARSQRRALAAPRAELRSSAQSEAWSGTCKLSSITKVEEREMPCPGSCTKAIYTPQSNPQYPQFTPSEVRAASGRASAIRTGAEAALRTRKQPSLATPRLHPAAVSPATRRSRRRRVRPRARSGACSRRTPTVARRSTPSANRSA